MAMTAIGTADTYRGSEHVRSWG